MSALGLTSGVVRCTNQLTTGAKRVEVSASALRQHSCLRRSAQQAHVTRGLAWEAQAQSTSRDPTAHAAAAQWGAVAEAPVADTKIASMSFDQMAANAVSLIGFTGKDVELRHLQSGKTVGNFTLAVNHKAGETFWYEVQIWGPMAERIAEQVRKGSRICIQGKLSPSTWTNREGVKQTKIRIEAQEVRFVERDGGVPAASAGQAGWGAQQPQQQQGWGAAPDQFDQAPPSGAEWGSANNVIPSAQAMSPAHPAGTLSPQSSAEEKWQSVKTNPGLWWDNRTNKRNPKGPDFSLKDKSVGIALWLNSYDTPEWAKQELQTGSAAPAFQKSGFTDMN